MSTLSSFVVQKPLNLLIIAALFVGFYVVLRITGLGEGRRPGLIIVPAIAWGFYAVWEWLVMTRSPEANIRVDLMLILPVIFALSIWFVVKALRVTIPPP